MDNRGDTALDDFEFYKNWLHNNGGNLYQTTDHLSPIPPADFSCGTVQIVSAAPRCPEKPIMRIAMNQPTINTENENVVILPSGITNSTKPSNGSDDALPSAVWEGVFVATSWIHRRVSPHRRTSTRTGSVELRLTRGIERLLRSPSFLIYRTTTTTRQRSRKKRPTGC